MLKTDGSSKIDRPSIPIVEAKFLTNFPPCQVSLYMFEIKKAICHQSCDVIFCSKPCFDPGLHTRVVGERGYSKVRTF